MIRRKRAQDGNAAAALDGCLTAVEAGTPVREAVARHPELEEELSGLLAAARDVRSALQVQPDPARRAFTRARVLATAAAARSAPAARPSPWFRLGRALAPVAAAFLALALLLSFSVSASAHALPGDTFYPLKLALERARYAVAFSDEDRAALHVEFAQRRLEEISALEARGRTVSEDVLNALAAELNAAVRARQRGDLRDGDQARLETVAESARTVLQTLAEQAPNDAARRALEAAGQAAPVPVDPPGRDRRPEDVPARPGSVPAGERPQPPQEPGPPAEVPGNRSNGNGRPEPPDGPPVDPPGNPNASGRGAPPDAGGGNRRR